jgi:S1-C subfamily serine protease
VHPDGQGEKAGISTGSIVIAVAGKEVKNVVDFQVHYSCTSTLLFPFV